VRIRHHLRRVRPQPHAHAKIKSIDASAAKKLKGVLAVYTGKELVDSGVKPSRWLVASGLKIPPRMRSPSIGRATWRGGPVVIAENPYVARDAVDLVEVDYEPLPPSPTRPRRCSRRSGGERRGARQRRVRCSWATRRPPTRRSPAPRRSSSRAFATTG